MKKKIITLFLICLVLIGGVITAYVCFIQDKTGDYTNEMFVDRGQEYGYAKMYDLRTGL